MSLASRVRLIFAAVLMAATLGIALVTQVSAGLNLPEEELPQRLTRAEVGGTFMLANTAVNDCDTRHAAFQSGGQSM